MNLNDICGLVSALFHTVLLARYCWREPTGIHRYSQVLAALDTRLCELKGSDVVL